MVWIVTCHQDRRMRTNPMMSDDTFLQHMIKDSMRGSKDNIPDAPPSEDELNHDEYVRQRIEHDNPGPGAADLVERRRLLKEHKTNKEKEKIYSNERR